MPMSTHSSPVFFPTKVAIIDDDPEFLTQVSLLIDDNVPCELFTSPSEALETIQDSKVKNDHFARQCARQWGMGGTCREENFDDEKNNLHRIVSNDHRFDHYSVMVIDYAMPEMTGLELCQLIRDPWIKKILITGKADLDVAVQAFNHGIIDRFIRKEEEHMDIKLNSEISKLSRQFFTEITMPYNTILKQEETCLFDPDFGIWFKELCKKYDIVEYYLKRKALINEFLLVSREGDIKYLLLQTTEQGKAQFEVARENTKIPKKLFDLIYRRLVIPYFSGRCDYDVSYKESWQNYVYTSYEFQDYRYVLVDANDLPELEYERVGLSYKQFLNDFYYKITVN